MASVYSNMIFTEIHASVKATVFTRRSIVVFNKTMSDMSACSKKHKMLNCRSFHMQTDFCCKTAVIVRMFPNCVNEKCLNRSLNKALSHLLNNVLLQIKKSAFVLILKQ